MSGKLRHIAITVPDPEKAAQFYIEVFGMHPDGMVVDITAKGWTGARRD